MIVISSINALSAIRFKELQYLWLLFFCLYNLAIFFINASLVLVL